MNDAPILSTIQDLEFNEDESDSITLSGSDIDQDDLTFNISGGSEITATLVGDTVEFSAPNNYNGSETFIVTVSDGILQDTQSFSVTVNAVNDAPVAATGISGLTDEDQSIVISLSATDIDGDNLTYSLGNDGLNGSVLINGTLATYTPSANFNGSDSFTFIVSDGTLTDEAEVTLTINAVNDAPVFLTDSLLDVDENSDYFFEISVDDVDNENGELSLSISNNPDWLSLDGFNLVGTPGDNDVGTSYIFLDISDGLLNTVIEYQLVVNPVNDPPTAFSQDLLTQEDQSLVIVLSALDIDSDLLTYQIVQNPINGTVEITENIVTYNPINNFNGLDSFIFGVSDGEFLSENIITITIEGVNDAPDIAEISDLIISEDTQLTYDVIASDVDGDDLEYSSTSTSNEVITWFTGSTLNVLPDQDWFGSSIITVIVNDQLVSSSQNFILTVESVNDAPLAVDENIILDEDSQSIIVLNGDDIDSFVLTYNILTPPSNGEYNLNSSFLTYIPNENYFGQDTLIYNVFDGELFSNEAYVIYDIQGINDAPQLPDFVDVEIDEDNSYETFIPQFDIDGDSLVYTINLSDEDASYSLVNEVLTINPGQDYNGTIFVTISVSDGIFSDSGLFILDILPVNDPPQITSIPNNSIGLNELFEYQIEVYDPDSEQFTFEILNFPDGMALIGDVITWIPNITGLFGPIEIIVSDQNTNPLSDIQTFSLDVRLAQNFSLHSGNNLISYLGVLEDNSIDNMLLPLSNNISQIITENYASIYSDDGYWIGSIDFIEPTKGYWFRIDEDTDYNIATYQTPTNQLYSLHEGWNLISYIGDDNVDLDFSLPDDIELLFTDIMSENISATRDEDGEWVGSLASIGWQQLKGYWVKVLEDVSFTFEYEDNLPRYADNLLPDNGLINNNYGFGYNQSQNQSFYFIKDIILEGSSIENGDIIIAYHNGIIVGSRAWNGVYTDVPTMGNDGYSENILYCENGSSIEFKLFKKSTAELIDLVGEIPNWENQKNIIISTLKERSIIPETYNLSAAYPNPFNPVTHFNFSIPKQSDVKISVYDLQGRLVEEIINQSALPGTFEVKWDARNYSSGIYFINMIADDFSTTQKITLLK